jgi:hypothetical protein
VNNQNGKDYVDSTQLGKLLSRLESGRGSTERSLVVSHIGSAAYANFKLLASQFENQFVIISDLAVKTTYFTILNLVSCKLPPLTAEVRPLSNLALALDKCQSLIQVR